MSQASDSLRWPGRLWETLALAPMATRDPLDLTEAGRLRRLEALDELLSTLTGVLDVRDVFVRISEIAFSRGRRARCTTSIASPGGTTAIERSLPPRL
jgi:hypothetical protein